MTDNYIIDVYSESPSDEVIESLDDFLSEIRVVEKTREIPLILFQDGKSEAYYIECHIEAGDAAPLLDFDAAIDPEEQEEFRLQRELQPTHRSYLQMVSDAKGTRQFSDLIAEYNTSYVSEKPLKILGGQHRAHAMVTALEDDSVSRNHGFKIYFSLSREQRNEIAIIANTNISISTDLIDRMDETKRGPQLRDFCHTTGLLVSGEDFSDRRRADGRITVRIARTFIVNFVEGLLNKDQNPSEILMVPYLVRPGQDDEKYLTVIQDETIWLNEALIEAARQFVKLHQKQMSVCAANPDLNTGEYRNKATSFAVLSSWSFVAGFSQDKPDQLEKLYSLPDRSGTQDPLSAKLMSESKHAKDPPTYRGLGVRYGEEDRGRVTELFITYIQIETPRFSRHIIESAIMNYVAKVANIEAARSRSRLR